MIDTPLVTVLMPAYNSELYLGEAIESVLKQTFQDFEFIIINDGSTDETGVILDWYRQQDSRIQAYHVHHQGYVPLLNMGCQLAQGKYIARMDADDISLPDRLTKQVAFMEAHLEIGLCGTWVKTIGQTAGLVWTYVADDPNIRCQLLFDSVLAHPSVMIRRDLFERMGVYYDSCFEPAEDYELWARAAKYAYLANLPEILLLYRVHIHQVGQRFRPKQLASAGRVRLKQLENLGIQPTTAEFELHQAISQGQFQSTTDFVQRSEAWLNKLKEANGRSSIYPEPTFSRVLGEYWYFVCRAATRLGWWAWCAYWQSPLAAGCALSWKRRAKFGALCALKSGTEHAQSSNYPRL
jgi:glycosyltransferase involved in cell wall biosynthesis